ncbi:MAG: ribosomal L7Ae/L30e/S12e/Gadd45 family protein [Bacillota bacterium]|nr:ribosomal L7Ae/L30e/S12e/Gadd45 family protein [Bacillota bacterium]
MGPMAEARGARRVVGTKQTLKAVQRGQARLVCVARDADRKVIEPLLKLCDENHVAVSWYESMMELGRECGIDVGTAAAAILRETG